jgi:hypothetical protein
VIPNSPLLALLGQQPSLTGFREVAWSDALNDRRRMLAADNPDAMVRPGWQYLSRDSYVANAYLRPATLLNTLERMVGRDRWWTFMRRFHEQARFGHPTTEDFVALLGTECGAGAAEFFRLAIRADAKFDYGIDRVSPADGRGPVKSVIVRRHGSLTADVRVRFRFAGRSEPVWRLYPKDDLYPWREFRFVDRDSDDAWGRLLEVWIDPPVGSPGTDEPFELDAGSAGVYLIDENLLDNAWQASPDRGPARYRAIRRLLQTQTRLTFAGLIG